MNSDVTTIKEVLTRDFGHHVPTTASVRFSTCICNSAIRLWRAQTVRRYMLTDNGGARTNNNSVRLAMALAQCV
jgi:hypothetical protein